MDVEGGRARQVSEKKARQWCTAKGGIPHFDTSAKEDVNVDAAFQVGLTGVDLRERWGRCRVGAERSAKGGCDCDADFQVCGGPRVCTVGPAAAAGPVRTGAHVEAIPRSIKQVAGAAPHVQTIARNALKNETEEELYIPETVDVNAQAAPRRAQGCC